MRSWLKHHLDGTIAIALGQWAIGDIDDQALLAKLRESLKETGRELTPDDRRFIGNETAFRTRERNVFSEAWVNDTDAKEGCELHGADNCFCEGVFQGRGRG